MVDHSIEGSAEITGNTEAGISKPQKIIKIALEGGSLMGVIRLKAFRDKLTISIDDNVHTIVEKYEIKHVNPAVSIFDDGNAKFSLVHSELFNNDNPGK